MNKRLIPALTLLPLVTLFAVSSLATAQGVSVRQPVAVKARMGSGSGLGVSAEIPVTTRLRATLGLSAGKVTGGAKYFLSGGNYLAGEAGFTGGHLSDVNALVGHRFDARQLFFDVEGGVNLKAGVPVIGAGAGVRF